MAVYSSDSIIKVLRLEKGLTQAQLAEGICTRDTISRIERGERFPDWFTFKEIVSKLGQNPDLYYTSIVSIAEKEFLDKVVKLEQLVGQRKYCGGDLFKEVENDPIAASGLYKQFVLHTKAVFMYGQKADPNAVRNILIEAMRVNRPNFDENVIENYFLSEKEITILNTLSANYSENGNREKSLEIRFKLKDYMEKVYFDQSGECTYYRLILSNIGKDLRVMKRFDECIEICTLGTKNSQRVRNMEFYQKFIIMKSICLYSNGKKEEGISLFEKACHMYIGHDFYNDLIVAANYFKEEFNVCIDWVDKYINEYKKVNS